MYSFKALYFVGIPLFANLKAQENPNTLLFKDVMPPVFRCVLNDCPRILVSTFEDNYWCAWNTQRCRLYQLWEPSRRRGIIMRGAVYDGSHGPTPKSEGTHFYVGEQESAWFFKCDNSFTPLIAKYKGHSSGKDKTLTMEYVLTFSEREYCVSVTETILASQRRMLNRNFLISGLKREQVIFLRLGGEIDQWSVKSDHVKCLADNQSPLLVIEENGEFTLTGNWPTKP